ncbi:succinate dehydrogenase assembly factor 2 [Sphingomonas gilva]|uniref:FAD assembly factor SdhE n=1 Tax=Sphingomonas gilva TaxID=2305907 RepID=A0A396RLN3_9SPHN|nr:succinate dehydrogenase assembly factor 2 [Sphingomonas gilva]RHW17277.1 succinate dehydrogenase assembly factor 2 [Sphingomonas gilva]
MDRETRLKRLRFRAWHRGTKEADLMIGGFFDRHAADWGEAEMAWFEALLEEQDVDIMAWGMGAQPFPTAYQGPQASAFRQLDYIPIAE